MKIIWLSVILGLLLIQSVTVNAEGIIYLKVIDMTNSNFYDIVIYQNDNMSKRYIMTRNMSETFIVCNNITYDFVLIPSSINIIKNMDNYFLDYLFGNIYIIVFGLSIISISGYFIFAKK